MKSEGIYKILISQLLLFNVDVPDDVLIISVLFVLPCFNCETIILWLLLSSSFFLTTTNTQLIGYNSKQWYRIFNRKMS